MRNFKTDNLTLCPYLQINGLKYLGIEPGINKHDKPVVFFVFEDKKGIGKDLEIAFMGSDFKEYRDLWFFFRNEVEKSAKKLAKLQLEERRKYDDKYIDGA
jgi:hypothetical protein